MSALELPTEAALRAVAGEASFGRGEDYVRHVHGLKVTGTTAHASIQARNVYLVDLDWSGRRLTGACTCPHHARGNFCKHLVAVGLAVIGTGTRRTPSQPGSLQPQDSVATYLESLEAPALRSLVRELVDRDPESATLLEIRASAQLGDIEGASRHLVEMVSDTLRVRGFVDYRRSVDVAQHAQAMLDELEQHLEAGAPGAARPALLKALTRLRAISLHADDSSGSIGDACQRAADLYAQACRAGHPEPVKLARWLVTFREDSPGWPETTLADFVGAFDAAALRAYRKGVDALDRKHQGDRERQGEAYWHRHELERMLLELADHDGDVDRAVILLAHGEHPQYAAIVDRLRLAGRLDEVTTWVDRGVRAGRISREHAAAGRDYWLDPDEVAGEYLALDRVDDAVAVFRSELIRRPDPATFAALIAFAAMVEREAEERAWALEELRSKAAARFGNGAVLVQIAIAARDLEGAWRAADEFGPGHAWQSLAAASAQEYPARAAVLHRRQVDEALKQPDSSRYAGIAAALSTISELALRSGAEQEFAAYLYAIREKYKRRPALMAALGKRGL